MLKKNLSLFGSHHLFCLNCTPVCSRQYVIIFYYNNGMSCIRKYPFELFYVKRNTFFTYSIYYACVTTMKLLRKCKNEKVYACKEGTTGCTVIVLYL